MSGSCLNFSSLEKPFSIDDLQSAIDEALKTLVPEALSPGESAKRMLRMIGGRTHEVLTAVSIFHPGEIVDTRMDTTTVEFAELSDADIEWYVSSGEPMDKAGAYAVQGLASRFVTRVEGSYSNVVGLPIALVYQMLTTKLLTF